MLLFHLIEILRIKYFQKGDKKEEEMEILQNQHF